jgi:hypothetical protein
MIDRKAPSIAFTAPTVFTLGQPSSVSFTCADGGSGIQGCGTSTLSSCTTATAPSGAPASVSTTVSLSTGSLGSQSFTADAADAVCNQSSRTFSYTVQDGIKLLYKAPAVSNAGSTVNLKLELRQYVNGKLVNASSSSLGVTALCVVPAGTTSCGVSPTISLNKPMTFVATLDTGGGYQYGLKTPTTLTKGTYQLLFRAAGEGPTTFHAEAGATFTIG